MSARKSSGVRTMKTKTQKTEVKTEAATDVQKPAILKVKPGQKFRGARAAWYERLAKYDGKPVTDFLADVEKNRPSNYGARSKHAGSPEPTPGWLRFFVRTGVAELKQG